MVSSVANRQLLIAQMPSFLISFLVANQFYKFGSFGLELVAFLATWFIVDMVITKLEMAINLLEKPDYSNRQ